MHPPPLSLPILGRIRSGIAPHAACVQCNKLVLACCASSASPHHSASCLDFPFRLPTNHGTLPLPTSPTCSAYNLPFAVYQESDFDLRAQLAHCNACGLVLGLVLRKAVVLRDLDQQPDPYEGYPRELELAEHDRALLGTKFVRLVGPVRTWHDPDALIVYACSGARRTRDVAPVSAATGAVMVQGVGVVGQLVAASEDATQVEGALPHIGCVQEAAPPGDGPSLDVLWEVPPSSSYNTSSNSGSGTAGGGSSGIARGSSSPAGACSSTATAASSTDRTLACGQPLFMSDDVLSRSHVWDAGDGTERAFFVNGLQPPGSLAHEVVNVREEELAQVNVHDFRHACANCLRCVCGIPFVCMM